MGILVWAAVIIAVVVGLEYRAPAPAPAVKPQTLSCVRVKQVADGGVVEYRCEVKK